MRFFAEPDHPVTRAGSAPRCAPIWNASIIQTGLPIPCAALGQRAAGEVAANLVGRSDCRDHQRWQAIIAEYGAAAILPYSYSGTLGLLQLGVFNARLWNRMGASGLERSICGAAAEAAVRRRSARAGRPTQPMCCTAA